MADTGMWPHVLLDLSEPERSEAIEAVDAMKPDPVVRLARLLWPLARQSQAKREQALASVDALRPSRAERRRIDALSSAPVIELEHERDPVRVRMAVADLGREHLEDALSLLALPPADADAIRRACDNVPLTAKELPIKGRDLIAAGVVKPGPAVGDLLDALLERVLADPSLDDRERLMALALELTERP